MASRNSESLKDLNLSTDEVKNLTKAFENEEFRKLFVQYAEELQDPENKKKYEEEISQMENERGMDVQFIHPEPGHCLKTIIDGDKKAFINICTSDKIGKPTSKRSKMPDGRTGMNWQLPYSNVQPREDVDNNKKRCQVFDVVFHPDTYRMTTNPRFMQLVEDTAFEGLKSQLGVDVDRANVKRMKNIKFKGMPQASIIRTRKTDGEPEPTKSQEKGDGDDILKNMPYPYDQRTSEEKANDMKEQVKKQKEKTTKISKSSTSPEFTEPKYEIVHRSDMDIQDFRQAPDAGPNSRPKEIEIKIYLPLLMSAGQCDLDVFEQQLVLTSTKPAKYKLDLKLPYPVDDENGGAKFDKSKKCLVVILPVIPALEPEKPQFNSNLQLMGAESETPNDTGKPLIEELPSDNEEEAPPLEDISSESDADSSETSIKPTISIAYSFPDISFNQDDATVSFVLNIKNVKLENITRTFPQNNIAAFTLISIGSGGFPIHYRFTVKFAENNQVVSEHTTIDISDANVVIVLLKDRGCRGLWDKFHAGIEEDSLQEFLFVTESNIQQELEELEADAARVKQEQHAPVAEDIPEVQVTDMTEKKLSIVIKKPGNIDEDGNWEDIPESPEIQVVHEKATPPNLHGILKQRSMSESSDDYSNGSPCSPRDDPFGERKSVSFNEHVDHALFKSTMSVSTMHKALKSKKKRTKKREGRRRKNSGGSEGSSSEETEVCGTRAKSLSTSEESDENSDKLDEISEEDQVTDQPEVAMASKQDQMVKNIMQKISKTNEENLQETVADSDDDIDVGDKVKSAKTKSKKGKSVQFGNTSNDENHERTSKCDKVVGENEKCESECVEIGSKSSENDGSENDKMAGKKVMNVDDNLRKEGSKTKVKKDQAKSDKSKSIDLKVSAGDVISNSGIPSINDDVSLIKVAADKGEDSGVESTGEAPDQSLSNENETSLSWDDSIDVSNQEHKTNCAFDFSNAVIFDLDVD